MRKKGMEIFGSKPKEQVKNPENREPKEWREVQRAHEVVAIGDLHGRYEAFLENGKHANILKEKNDNTRWTGGDRAVVFLGDILADRFIDGPRILKKNVPVA
ncbi:MAG: hypothetical protein AAB448_05015 [Patescibacteria group bacterium]